ncbi:MAG: radical SAM protein [Firmicutes bacterium]|nr:radical SAM protein [Bacillota bacterium]
MFNLVFADEKGRVFDHPDLQLVGRLGNQLVEAVSEEMIPLPDGASLTLLPDRYPVGFAADTGEFTVLTSNPFNRQTSKVSAVAALLPQGYTRTLLPGFVRPRGAGPLPLFGYAAVGWRDGGFYVAAQPTDEDHQWNPRHYNGAELAQLVAAKREQHPHNRILRQLSRCALEYSCYTAQNIFYGRWEGGIPVSPGCNAQCLGCISEQPAECCPAPQSRIDFTPTVEEIVEVAVDHLMYAPAGIVSFGQGCEGEPALRARDLGPAIRRIRELVSRGTINMNTNGGYTEGIRAICTAGLEAIRVSLISTDPQIYASYYRPRGYTLENVVESLRVAVANGVYTSLNLLVFPGVTDREEEVEGLINLVEQTGVHLIQLRNLNIDPDVYLATIPPARGETLGIPGFLQALRENLPRVAIGSFSRPVR